jgi:acyl-CoA synthetase (AMP-forming)/AMP-acid ligase II
MNGALKIADLQQFFATRIPKYMIPEQIEFLEVLPKTSTGKIDRQRLVQSNN